MWLACFFSYIKCNPCQKSIVIKQTIKCFCCIKYICHHIWSLVYTPEWFGDKNNVNRTYLCYHPSRMANMCLWKCSLQVGSSQKVHFHLFFNHWSASFKWNFLFWALDRMKALGPTWVKSFWGYPFSDLCTSKKSAVFTEWDMFCLLKSCYGSPKKSCFPAFASPYNGEGEGHSVSCKLFVTYSFFGVYLSFAVKPLVHTVLPL